MFRFVMGMSLPALLLANSTGAPAGNTWIDNAQTCTRSGCHTGAVNGGVGAIAVSFPGNLTYTPGVKQRITITVTDASQPLNFGFQATARMGQNALQQAGTFTPVDASTQVTCGDGTARGATCPAGAPLEFISHSTPSATGVWQLDWTPPEVTSGDIRFYVSGVAGSGDGTANNDRTYMPLTTVIVVQPANGVSITTAPLLPAGTMFTNYSAKLNATGGTGAYFWAIESGSQPMTLSSDGTLSGVPNAAGTYRFVASVTDLTGARPKTLQQFTLNIAAQPNFTTIAIPNTTSVIVRGMNSRGDVVGQLSTSASGYVQAFVRLQSGIVQVLNIPNASWAIAYGINDEGDVVGAYGSDKTRGFLLTARGDFTPIERPGVEQTTAIGINTLGQITGHSYANGKYSGWLYMSGGGFTDISSLAGSIQPLVINNRGQVLLKRFTEFPNSTTLTETGVNLVRDTDGELVEISSYAKSATTVVAGVLYTGFNNKGVLIANGQIRRLGEDAVEFTLPGGYTPLAVSDSGGVAGQGFLLSACSGPVVPASASHGSGLEIGSTNLLTGATCFWQAETTTPWINMLRSVGDNRAAVAYGVGANTSATPRTGAITLGGSTYTVNQQGAGCTYTVSPANIALTPAGATGTITVTTQPGCNWVAGTFSPWIAANGFGSGSGEASYTALPNLTSLARTAVLSISGQLVNVTQAALPCSYAISTPQTVPGSGGTQALTVTTQNYCEWQATSNASWITVTTSGSPAGSGVRVVVAANPTTQTRTGTITIANQTVTITQLGSPACVYVLSANYLSFNAAGGSGSVAVTVGNGCFWTIETDSNWITLPVYVTAPSGNGTLTFSVAANNGGARGGTVRIGGVPVTVVQAERLQTNGLRFVPMTPCRLMETRSAYNFEGRTGAFGPPSLAANDLRVLVLQGSTTCPVPPTAKAYALNVTLIPKTTADYVTLYPTGETRPAYWTVRSPDGQTVANSAIVRAGGVGGINVYSSDAADLLIDITGYYTDSTAVTGLAFYPLAPCRVIDTRAQYRPQAGAFGPPSMTAGQTRKFKLPSTPYCQVPNAAAYSVTLTAVPPGALAYMTAWADGATQPNVSSINSFGARTVANNIIVPASADGTIDVFSSDATDFLMDINGYYAPDDGQTGQFYFPVTQCRVSDSRTSGGAYADTTARTIAIVNAASCPGIPATARGYALNFTVIPNGTPMPFLTAYPTGQQQPNASVLNAFQGQTITNSSIIPAGTGGAIDVYTFRRTDVVVEISGYFGR